MENEIDDYEENQIAYKNCYNCSRSLDDIDYDYQICSKCGWDADNKTFTKKSKPTQKDYENGDADILTGEWY